MTVSEASRRAIAAWSGWPDRRIRVITEGPDPDLSAPGATTRRRAPCSSRFAHPARTSRFLLYVGGLSPHKNLLRLVEAFAQGAPGRRKLVLVGDVHDVFHTHVPQIRAAIARHDLHDRVIMTGFVPDDDLVFLYSRAYALILPSLLEGFGLPAVEAMACGTPVISSRPARCRRSSARRAFTSTRPTSARSPARSGRSWAIPPFATSWPGWPWSGRRSSPGMNRPGGLLDCFDELGNAHSARLHRIA